MHRIFLIFAVLQCASGYTVNDCIPSLTRDGDLQVFGNHCFQFYPNTNYEYNLARYTCEHKGGHLAMPKTAELNNFLADQLENTYRVSQDVWIGLTDGVNEGTFVWADDTPLTWERFPSGEGYHDHWLQGVEDCAAIRPGDGSWHDDRCGSIIFIVDAHRPFVCQYPVVPTTTTSTTSTTTTTTTHKPSTTSVSTRTGQIIPSTNETTAINHSAYTVNDCHPNLNRDEYLQVFEDSCFQFYPNTRLIHQTANAMCNDTGGYLAMPKNLDTNTFLTKKLLQTYGFEEGEVWIGLSQLSHNTGGIYFSHWDDGSKLNWNVLNMNFSQVSKECVTLNIKDNTWFNTDCNEKKYFVCQSPVTLHL